MNDLARAITQIWNDRGFHCAIIKDNIVIKDTEGNKKVVERYNITTPLYKITIEERELNSGGINPFSGKEVSEVWKDIPRQLLAAMQIRHETEEENRGMV